MCPNKNYLRGGLAIEKTKRPFVFFCLFEEEERQEKAHIFFKKKFLETYSVVAYLLVLSPLNHVS